MVKLTHLSGSLQGTASTSPKAVIRIGRGADCDIRFNAQADTKVSTHHAEIRFEDGGYFLIDTGSSNGTLLNGKRVQRQKLRKGDRIGFGAGGPEAEFGVAEDAPLGNGHRGPLPPSPFGAPPASPFGPSAGPSRAGHKPPPMATLSDGKDAQQLAREAQQKINLARAMSGGQSSGQTMMIMADTLQKVEATTQRKESKKAAKVVGVIVLVALVVAGALSYVVWDKTQQLEAITHKKDAVDKQIQKLQLQMQIENDPERLASLEEQLTLLTGKAQLAIGEMEQHDKNKAAEMADAGDELDHEIRRILRKFEADTYAVPPLFKERLKFHIDAITHKGGLRETWARKKQYWPLILKSFTAQQLPEEIAYVAWVESYFNPVAESPVGARGMWQFMPSTARQYGLRVDENWKSGGHDDRIDPVKQTPAAAKYLANLLKEFGGESFMLAIASYNKGEQGMRNVLHTLSWRKSERDFWHLYRLKKLPDETLEYVPQILAAAIIGNNPQKYGLDP
jgi:membrane-bound lytic murein transglycosylase D